MNGNTNHMALPPRKTNVKPPKTPQNHVKPTFWQFVVRNVFLWLNGVMVYMAQASAPGGVAEKFASTAASATTADEDEVTRWRRVHKLKSR